MDNKNDKLFNAKEHDKQLSQEAEQYIPPRNGYDIRNEKIQYAQSFNLAVNVCGQNPYHADEEASKEYRDRFDSWQKYFYSKLTKR